MLEQAREAGWTGARIARATLAGGSPPRVDFVAEQGHCRRCGRVLSQQKSQTRVVATLAAGTFLAREIRKHCRACRSEPAAVCRQLAGLAPPGQRYGYDLLVWVGLARYHRHLQREEIRAALDRQGIHLSSGSVSALCDRFLAALEALHWQRAPALRAGMPHGYALHIDATGDKGKGGTFRCLDGWTGWVLHAVRIGSENERELRPAVERTLAAFGDPVAVMRDLGGAGAKAVADCRQRGIPDLLCQYHFLAAVGHQLLDDSYALLRTQITRSKVRARLRELLRTARSAAGVRADLPALLLWILEGEGRKDLPYPFSLPHRDFHLRGAQFPAERDRRLPRPRTRAELRVLRLAAEALADYQRLDRPGWAADRLQRGWAVFCQLRALLRLSDEELPGGPRPPSSAPLGPAAAAARLRAIAADLQRYHQDLRQRVRTPAADGPGSFQPDSIVLRYLDRYGDGLTGHPVVRDQAGRAVAVVDRTNNVIEQSFAITKQGLRRRLGRAQLGRDLEDQPAQAALAANLRHPDYVRILCGTLDQLPRAFAELDRHQPTRPPRLQRHNRDAELRRRNRAWADDARHCPPPNSPNYPQAHPELHVSN